MGFLYNTHQHHTKYWRQRASKLLKLNVKEHDDILIWYGIIEKYLTTRKQIDEHYLTFIIIFVLKL